MNNKFLIKGYKQLIDLENQKISDYVEWVNYVNRKASEGYLSEDKAKQMIEKRKKEVVNPSRKSIESSIKAIKEIEGLEL